MWTTFAHKAKWCMLVARTDPDVPKHQGLTYFIMDMEQEAVQVRPLHQITKEPEFNELFIEEARIPDENVVGGVGNGWAVAITTLMNERAGLGAAAAAGVRMALDELELAHERGADEDPVIRQRLAQLTIEVELLRLNSWRGLTQIMKRGVPGPEGSLPKWQWGEINQALTELAVDILGEEGAYWDSPWTYRLLRSRANSIEGGTTEILKNIIAERVLGLPKLRGELDELRLLRRPAGDQAHGEGPARRALQDSRTCASSPRRASTTRTSGASCASSAGRASSSTRSTAARGSASSS